VINSKNVAVLVTYNKIELLKECLNGVMKSSNLLDTIVIVNNNSTDGTFEYLTNFSKKNSKILVLNETKNRGGAAGFNLGIKQAMRMDADTIWIMDDDTVPDDSTLEKLLDAKERLKGEFDEWGILASNVRWIDGSAALMNIPKVDKVWNESMFSRMIAIKHSSFVSMLINATAVKELGYPISDFFIWGDDVEFSERVSARFPSFCVTDSRVVHKMTRNQRVDILSDDEKRIPRYYYDVRNKMYIVRQQEVKQRIKYYIHFVHILLVVLFAGRGCFKKLGVLMHGFWDGIFFHPKVEKYDL